VIIVTTERNRIATSLLHLLSGFLCAFPRGGSGSTIPMTPEMKEDLFEKLDEARELLRHDLRLPQNADDYDISQRLKQESMWRVR